MRTALFYLLLTLTAYLCQSVLRPLLLPVGLHLDFLLILVVHASFTHGGTSALLLAFLVGILSDVGFPPGLGFYPLFYLVVSLIAGLLWQNLNLQSIRYQAIFLGLCTLLQGGGLWLILFLQNPDLAGGMEIAQILAWRILVTAVLGPGLLYGLQHLERWFTAISHPEEYQEG